MHSLYLCVCVCVCVCVCACWIWERICVKPTFVFCGEGSEFVHWGHMFLIFPYTFMRYFCILRKKKGIWRKEYEERTDKKSVSPVEMSDQRAGLFHKQPAQWGEHGGPHRAYLTHYLVFGNRRSFPFKHPRVKMFHARTNTSVHEHRLHADNLASWHVQRTQDGGEENENHLGKRGKGWRQKKRWKGRKIRGEIYQEKNSCSCFTKAGGKERSDDGTVSLSTSVILLFQTGASMYLQVCCMCLIVCSFSPLPCPISSPPPSPSQTISRRPYMSLVLLKLSPS